MVPSTAGKFEKLIQAFVLFLCAQADDVFRINPVIASISAVKNEISRFVLMPIGSFLCSESNCRLVLFAKIPVASPRSKIVKKKPAQNFCCRFHHSLPDAP